VVIVRGVHIFPYLWPPSPQVKDQKENQTKEIEKVVHMAYRFAVHDQFP
jgi:hypothetical protein